MAFSAGSEAAAALCGQVGFLSSSGPAEVLGHTDKSSLSGGCLDDASGEMPFDVVAATDPDGSRHSNGPNYLGHLA